MTHKYKNLAKKHLFGESRFIYKNEKLGDTASESSEQAEEPEPFEVSATELVSPAVVIPRVSESSQDTLEKTEQQVLVPQIAEDIAQSEEPETSEDDESLEDSENPTNNENTEKPIITLTKIDEKPKGKFASIIASATGGLGVMLEKFKPILETFTKYFDKFRNQIASFLAPSYKSYEGNKFMGGILEALRASLFIEPERIEFYEKLEEHSVQVNGEKVPDATAFISKYRKKKKEGNIMTFGQFCDETVNNLGGLLNPTEVQLWNAADRVVVKEAPKPSTSAVANQPAAPTAVPAAPTAAAPTVPTEATDSDQTQPPVEFTTSA
ncbi:MAG: hypothetical protein K9M03_01065 [Kiritimatiellales bacterium]|nr:hypothetical protein [Kiritimatiellales bacterium]